MIEVDYGERTPMDFDRFGVRMHVRVNDGRHIREFTDANPRGIVKRLGLTLSGWAKRWPGMEVFELQIWGRNLEIRSYSDGRIKLFLDAAPVYTENIKIVTRHGIKHREVQQWYDPAVAEQEADDERERRHRSTYDELKAQILREAK
jgi:hypothetical protein